MTKLKLTPEVEAAIRRMLIEAEDARRRANEHDRMSQVLHNQIASHEIVVRRLLEGTGRTLEDYRS